MEFAGWLIRFIFTLLNVLFSLIAFVWRYLLNTLVSVGLGLKWLGRIIFAGLLSLFTHALVPLWQLVEQLFRTLRRWWRTVTDPILRVLERIRDIIDDIYERFFRPILQLLSMIRMMLHLTRLVETKLGKKIDDALAALEGKIAAPLLALMRLVNQHADLLNFILTVDRLLASPLLLRSVLRDIRQMTGIWWNEQRAGLTGRDQDRLDAMRTPTDFEAQLVDFRQLLATGGGPMQARTEQMQNLLREIVPALPRR